MFNATPLLKTYANYRWKKINTASPARVQEETLFSLLKKSQSTAFGVDHQFSSIKSVDHFQASVPLRRYEEFWNQYWSAHYPVLNNISWPGTVPYFALTSGTTSGTTKYIPVTHEMIRSNTKAGLDMLSFHLINKPDSKIFGGKNFLLGGSTELTAAAPGVYSGDLSGIAVTTLPWWARARYFPPSELALLKNWEEKMEKLSKGAIREDIRMLSGVPSWMLIFFRKLSEITGGKSIAEIFPNLELLVHGGVNFSPYHKQFKELLHGSTAEMREVYPASEGFLGVADRGYGEGLRLVLDNGIFYEFVPLEELSSENPTRHWIGNVETDINYAIVLSTCAGVWSYVLGDTVKFIDTKTPRILITGRTSYSLSAFGEHLIAEEVEKAMSGACDELKLSVSDYSVGAVYPEKSDELGGHLYIIEADRMDISGAEKERFISKIDSVLCALNEDYEAHRAKGFGLNLPKVQFVPAGTFAAWMKSRGKLGGQNKVPRLISDRELFSGLREFCSQA